MSTSESTLITEEVMPIIRHVDIITSHEEVSRSIDACSLLQIKDAVALCELFAWLEKEVSV